MNPQAMIEAAFEADIINSEQMHLLIGALKTQSSNQEEYYRWFKRETFELAAQGGGNP